MKYKDQLKTSAWMRKKYEILNRDNFVCSKCLCDNFERQLDVHHIAYIPGKYAWQYMDYTLVTLCRDCHKIEHELKNIYNPKPLLRPAIRKEPFRATRKKGKCKFVKHFIG